MDEDLHNNDVDMSPDEEETDLPTEGDSTSEDNSTQNRLQEWVINTGTDSGTPGETPSTPTSPSEPEEIIQVNIPIKRRWTITNYDLTYLRQLYENGGVFYVIYEDGTEDECEYTEVVNPFLINQASLVLEVDEITQANNQHFWHDNNGAHVTDETRDSWEENASLNFSDLSDTSDHNNILINSYGLVIRKALNNIAAFSKSAVSFYDGDGNNANNIVALFGRNGARIGSFNNANIAIDQTRISGVSSAGMKFLDMSFNRATETRQVESEQTYCISLDRVTITLDTSIWAVGEWPPPQDTRIDIYCIYDAGAAVSEFSSFWYGMPEQGTMTAIRFAYDGDMTVTVEPTMICVVYFKYEASFPTPSFSLGSGLANNAYAVSEGHSTYANGYASHAEGDRTVAGSSSAHAEGQSCKATGVCSHAEGMNSEATGGYAHAEGDGTKAINTFSHAEGSGTQAAGSASHSEGSVTRANGAYSHSQNRGTYADGDSQTAIGKYNERDTSNTYALIVGNGQDFYNRSNAMTLDWDGNLDIAGKLSVADLSWEGNVNLVPTATANNQEWSIDLDPNGFTGTYWHVWTSAKSTILKCDTDTGRVTMPYEVYSNARYNVKMGSIQRGVKPSAVAYGNYEVKDANEKRLSITEFCCNTDGTNELRFYVLGNIASGDYYSGIIIRKAFENTASASMIYNANNGNLELGGAGTVYSGWDTAYNNGVFATRSSKASLVMANRSAQVDYGGLYICNGTVDNFVARSIIREAANNGNRNYLIEVSRTINGTRKWNSIVIALDNAGNPVYSVSSAANFRSAIGAQASGNYAPHGWTQKATANDGNTLTYSLSGCTEVMFAALSGTAYLGSVVLPVGLLHASTQREVYLTGARVSSTAGRGFALKATTTRAVAATRTADNSSVSCTWWVYAR